MFTGIVKYLGEVKNIVKKSDLITILVECPELISYHLGGSIMINGVCLTLVKVENGLLCFDVISETLKVTNLSQIKIGDKLNLEPSLTLQNYIDGHLVSGHIDFMAELKSVNELNEYVFELPLPYAKFVALKGSIALNGVSLTVSGLEDSSFKVSLIPTTLDETNLKYLQVSDKVNVEVDILARYLERLNNFK